MFSKIGHVGVGNGSVLIKVEMAISPFKKKRVRERIILGSSNMRIQEIRISGPAKKKQVVQGETKRFSRGEEVQDTTLLQGMQQAYRC